jgi:hypothetical protein
VTNRRRPAGRLSGKATSGDRNSQAVGRWLVDDDDVFIPSRRVVATPLAKDGAAEKPGAADDNDVFVPRNGVTAKLGAATATRAAIHARMTALEAEVLAAIGDDVIRRPADIEHDANAAPDDNREMCAYGCGGLGSDHKYDCAWWDNEGADETPF